MSRGETKTCAVRSHLEPARNVRPGERLLSGALGWSLVRAGFRRRGVLPGLALMGLGAVLVRRGATGRCPVYRQLGIVLNP